MIGLAFAYLVTSDVQLEQTLRANASTQRMTKTTSETFNIVVVHITISCTRPVNRVNFTLIEEA